MKKFELKNLIKEIVQRKLNEDVGQNAYAVNKIVSENSIKDVKIMTHAGSHNLEIVEVYENNGVLYFSVNADPVEQNETIQEIGEVGADESGSTDTDAPESGMKDSDKKLLATYQEALDKFTNDISKIDADVVKLRAPVQTKIEGLERKKADLEKNKGRIVDKIKAIQDKQ